jgi:hypothetical protein
VQDITRLILRLVLRVAAGGDAKSFPTILSNLLQVRIVTCSKKAPLGRLFTLVGRADITRLILRLVLRVAAGGDAKSFPTILSNLLQVRIVKFCR